MDQSAKRKKIQSSSNLSSKKRSLSDTLDKNSSCLNDNLGHFSWDLTFNSVRCTPRSLVSSPGNLAKPIKILLSQDATSSFSSWISASRNNNIDQHKFTILLVKSINLLVQILSYIKQYTNTLRRHLGAERLVHL